MENLRVFTKLIMKRRRDILLVSFWTIALALIMIANHHHFYQTDPVVSYQRLGFLEYRGPAPTELDLALTLALGIAVSIFLVSMRSLVFGFFASTILSNLIAVIYMFLFNWYVLGLGADFSQLPFGWEWVLFMAIINAFRYAFPIVITFSLMGVVIGSVLRMLTNRG